MTQDQDYAAFVQAELPGLLRFAHLITGNAHAAEEAVQAALVKTLRTWPRVSLSEEWRPGAYVRRAIVNNHLDAARRWSNRITLGPVPDRELPDQISAWIEHDALVRALRSLPARQRAVLVLRYFADMSEAEIADFLGCRPGTVKSAAARGLAALRAYLNGSADPEPARVGGAR